MAVKKGYKQTEVGVIPEDWEIKNLQELCWFQEGPGLRNWQFTSSGMKVINVTNLEDGVLNLERTDRHISMSEFGRMYRHFAIDAFDIVMASSGNTYSKTAVVRTQDLPLVMNTSVIRFKPSKFCTYGYLWALLRSPSFKEQIDLMITGGAQPNFGPYHLRRVIFPFPTLREQEAIAGALSDADAWIESLEQLIAKKRQIKQGAMQELLTGKRRLPGFSGKWEKKRLGEHCRFLRNGTNSRADLNVDGPLKYLHYGDIHSCNNVYMSPKLLPSLPMSKANTLDRLQDGDLVLADASEDTIGISKSVEIVGVDSFELVAGLHTIAVRFSTGLFAPKFVGFLQHCPDFNLHLRKLAAGTKVFATNRRHVSSAEVCVPPLKEQTAIATVLLDMDTEIGSLESKLGKAREIKQGMMQELLTGKIRLV